MFRAILSNAQEYIELVGGEADYLETARASIMLTFERDHLIVKLRSAKDYLETASVWPGRFERFGDNRIRMRDLRGGASNGNGKPARRRPPPAARSNGTPAPRANGSPGLSSNGGES